MLLLLTVFCVCIRANIRRLNTSDLHRFVAFTNISCRTKCMVCIRVHTFQWKIHFKRCLPAACTRPSCLARDDQGMQEASPKRWCDPVRSSKFPRCISVMWFSHTHWGPKDHNCNTEYTAFQKQKYFISIFNKEANTWGVSEYKKVWS